jgi:hypothetical protein
MSVEQALWLAALAFVVAFIIVKMSEFGDDDYE